MSLYRQAGRARRRRRIAIAAGAVVALVVVLAGVLVASSGPPTHADRVKAARSAAQEALDGVEIITVEYPQAVRAGRVIAPTEYAGAMADVQRIRRQLDGHRSDFQAVNTSAYRSASGALAALAATVSRRGDITQAVAAARAALKPFS